jgi:hypothetical protein
MLHDGVLSRQCVAAERRYGRRVMPDSDSPTRAELILVWLHDPATPVRYRMLDAGQGGFRVASACPLTEGMAGIIRRILPEGKVIDRAMVVAWSRPAKEGVEHEAGLRFL